MAFFEWLRKKLGTDQLLPKAHSTSNEGRLLDFRNWSERGSGVSLPRSPDVKLDDDVPVQVNPADVVAELERKPDGFTLQHLDEKLEMLRAKKGLVRDHYSEIEVDSLIERLELRKRWNEPGVSEFFTQFDNTTDASVDAFCAKYNLVVNPSNLFILDLPDEAVKVMVAYTEATEKLTGKKPMFLVIATPESFKAVTDRRDPILLAQSPFGFYYQILGAWDKEMLNVHEL